MERSCRHVGVVLPGGCVQNRRLNEKGVSFRRRDGNADGGEQTFERLRCEISSWSMSPPQTFAHFGSSACSTSMTAAVPRGVALPR